MMTKTWAPTYRHGITSTAMNDTLTANAYEAIQHAPNDAQVEISYVHFKHETVAQFLNIVDGEHVRPIYHPGGSHEYPTSSDMFRDIETRGLIFTRDTRASGDSLKMPRDHPMHQHMSNLMPTGWVQLTLNDVFRFVHDYHGHYGGLNASHYSFGPQGERNAWLRHRELYSREALMALWCETRGQSAWVNDFDDHRSLPLSERPFATQKAGFVPATFR